MKMRGRIDRLKNPQAHKTELCCEGALIKVYEKGLLQSQDYLMMIKLATWEATWNFFREDCIFRCSTLRKR